MQRGERHGKTMISRALHDNFNSYSSFLFRHHCTNSNNNTCNVIRRSSRSRIFVVEPLPRVPESPTRKFLLVESGILGSGIRKPTNDSGIRKPCSTDKESRTRCLESGILDVESKIQDCFSLFPPCQKLKNTVKRSI